MQKRLDEASDVLRRAVAIQERVFGPVHPRVASAVNDLGAVALRRGNYDEAEAAFRRMADIYRMVYGNEALSHRHRHLQHRQRVHAPARTTSVPSRFIERRSRCMRRRRVPDPPEHRDRAHQARKRARRPGALRRSREGAADRLRDPDEADQSVRELAQDRARGSGEAVYRVESAGEGEEVPDGTAKLMLVIQNAEFSRGSRSGRPARGRRWGARVRGSSVLSQAPGESTEDAGSAQA